MYSLLIKRVWALFGLNFCLSTAICKLIEGEYQMEKFVQGDRLKSSVFLELELTAEAIFSATSII
jgi:hypothetical protein